MAKWPSICNDQWFPNMTPEQEKKIDQFWRDQDKPREVYMTKCFMDKSPLANEIGQNFPPAAEIEAAIGQAL